MTASDRSSARAADESGDTLVRRPGSGVSGADGGNPHTHHTNGPALGCLDQNPPKVPSIHELHAATRHGTDGTHKKGSARGGEPVDESGRDHLDHPSNILSSGADGSRGGSSAKPSRVSRWRLAELKSALTDRDWAIVRSLEQLHFLTTRQLERLHCPSDSFTQLSAARTTRRQMIGLHQYGLVERLERRIGGLRAGSASFVYRLSPLGARLLNHPSRRRSREPSLLHLTHVLAVAELVVRLHESARAEAEVEVIEVQGEPDCWRSITAPHGGRLLLKPDLRLTVGVGDRELHWFVEQDNNSEHRPVLTRKCQAYLQAWRDATEQTTSGVFPRVLWVVPDEIRAAVMHSVIGGLKDAPADMFIVATTERAMPVLCGADP
jgi:hypothetical protein